MLTIEISWEEIKFFIAICLCGIGYGYYCYRNGVRRGWDESCYQLFDSGFINIDPETLEVTRVSDKEFRKIRDSIEEFD